MSSNEIIKVIGAIIMIIIAGLYFTEKISSTITIIFISTWLCFRIYEKFFYNKPKVLQPDEENIVDLNNMVRNNSDEEE